MSISEGIREKFIKVVDVSNVETDPEKQFLVWIHVGNQSFRLEYRAEKEAAEWYAKQLSNALANLVHSLTGEE